MCPSSPTRLAWCALVIALLAPRALEARRAPPRPGPVEIQVMGGRGPGVTDALRARMREQVVRQVRVLSEARLLPSPYGYVVDGSIETVQIVERPDGVELTCRVRLILSGRRSGAMLLMTQGEASLRSARRSLKPAQREQLVHEVLEGAVRAASDELLQHYQAQRKS